MAGIKILGTGSKLPEMIVTNDKMTEIVDTSDEWIATRTGIRSRHFVDGETNLDLAAAACRLALADGGVSPSEIGLIICATLTADYLTPSMACLLQRELAIDEGVLAFDLNAACSGFVYALHVAGQLLAGSPAKKALVVGSEVLSGITDFSDRGTCVLFGDGAGAAVISMADDRPFFFSGGSIGGTEQLSCPRASKKTPFAKKDMPAPHPFIAMNGAEVFRFAVESFRKSVTEVLSQAGVALSEVDHFICHQANGRIISAAAKRMGIPMDKFFVNVETRGNTSSASVPIALDEAHRAGRFAQGDKTVAVAFGGGLTYGAVYFIW